MVSEEWPVNRPPPVTELHKMAGHDDRALVDYSEYGGTRVSSLSLRNADRLRAAGSLRSGEK
jgi:hypothetical protein